MAEVHLDRVADRREVNARIVYWGVEGAGKETNLRAIHRKLRPDHRGHLEAVATQLDPSVCSYRLPIELGEIAGVKTRIQIIAVPGGSEQAPTRKQLLDRVDGIVFVVDARRDRIDDNVASLEELRGALAAYGRALESVPLVVQYNHQDQSDPFVLEELHRKLAVTGAAVFEAVATDGTGVLPTLTTISKRVVRQLREIPEAKTPKTLPAAESPQVAQRPVPAPTPPPPIQPLRSATPEPARSAEPNRIAPPRDTVILADLERAALAPDVELEDERDHAISRAQGLLDAAWREEVEMLDTPNGESPLPSPDTVLHDDPWQVVEAGLAEIVGAHAIAVPVVIADAVGHELRFRLKVSLEQLLDE